MTDFSYYRMEVDGISSDRGTIWTRKMFEVIDDTERLGSLWHHRPGLEIDLDHYVATGKITYVEEDS